MSYLLRNGIYAIICCTILVVISYLYVDKAVAFWVYRPTLQHLSLLKFFTYISSFIFGVAALAYLYFLWRYTRNKTTYFDYVLLAVVNSMVIATYIKNQLKLIFGRTWPKTWTENNPSLIHDNSYGFHFFKGGMAYSSFPSGHTAVIVAATTVLWMIYPRGRWIYLSLIFLVIIGLIGLDFHFVSDVIAGGFVGGLTGYYVVKISGLEKSVHAIDNQIYLGNDHDYSNNLSCYRKDN